MMNSRQSHSINKITVDDPVLARIRLKPQSNAPKRTPHSVHGTWIPEQEKFIDLEFRRTSSTKGRQTVAKAPLGRAKIPGRMDIKQSSSSITSGMMGLDPLPPVVLKQLKERGTNFPETSSARFHQYEVMEMLKGEKKEHSKIHLKKVETDRAVVKQNLFDEELRYSTEYDDALEDFGSDADHFPKILHKSRSKHLKHIKCRPPSPCANLITILKPSKITAIGEEALDMATAVPLARPLKSFQYELGEQKVIPMSKRTDIHAEVRDRHSRSRKIAREIIKQLTSTESSSSKIELPPTECGYINDEGCHGMSVNLKSELFQRTSDRFNECGDIISSSLYNSRKPSSSLSREPTKCLSKHWEMTQKLQEVGHFGRGSGTLGEIPVGDKEMSRTRQSSSKSVSRKVVRDELLARWDWPLGINSKDSWKDGLSRNLAMSKSLPASSLVCGNYSGERNKVSWTSSSKSHYGEDEFFSCREEGELTDREIHDNSEELRNMLDEELSMVSKSLNHYVSGEVHVAGINAQQVQQSSSSVLTYGGESSSTNLTGAEKQEISIGHPQIPSLSDIPESVVPNCSKESDQSSPLSCLDPVLVEEDKPSSECFNKISAVLRGKSNC